MEGHRRPLNPAVRMKSGARVSLGKWAGWKVRTQCEVGSLGGERWRMSPCFDTGHRRGGHPAQTPRADTLSDSQEGQRLSSPD